MELEQKEFHLSSLDEQLIFRNYGRQFVFFPFTTRALQMLLSQAFGMAPPRHYAGIRTSRATWTFLTPLLHAVRLLNPDPVRPDAEALRIFAASFEVATSPRFDYDLLGKDGFLLSELPSEIFCPQLLRLHPGLDDDDPFAERLVDPRKGTPVPVTAAQATFVPQKG